MRSVGNISSASLSVIDTGTPEFVNRIYAPVRLGRGDGRGQGVPSRVRLAYPASPLSPPCAENLTMSCSARL